MRTKTVSLLPVSLRLRQTVKASSYREGRNAFYAIDESMLTWWQPEEGDKEPCLTVNLSADYTVSAVRII